MTCIVGMKLKSEPDTTQLALRLRDPERIGRAWISFGVLLLLFASLAGSQFNPAILLDHDSLSTAADFFDTFWPPRSDADFLRRLFDASVVTVSIATVATVLAMIVATPLAVAITSRLSLSARGRRMKTPPRLLRGTLRGVLLFLRSVPELIWALLFVGVTGLGATAGIMGLLITNIGILAKNYAEIIESGEATVTGHMLDNGNGRCKTLLHATLPQCLPELLSYSIYRWECTLRTSVVLGFVGAGGLGQELLISIRQLASPEVFSIILVFVLLVSVADAISNSLRRQLSQSATQHADQTAGASDTDNDSGPSARWQGQLGKASSLLRRWGRPCLVGLAVLACFNAVDWQLEQWLRPSSFARTREFIQGFFPPDLSAGLWQRLAGDALETLSMAFAGTALASIVAIVLSYVLFIVNLRGAGLFVRLLTSALHLLQIVLRSVPELVWAMLLIIVAGIGPFTGTLALFLASVGVLSRLYSECLDNQDDAPLENLVANGSSLGLAPLWSTLMQARSQLISYSLYRWEHNLRAATLMGIVGAGGVGQELYLRLSVFQFDKVAACVVVIVVLVALADSISHFLRHRYAPTV